MAAAPSAPLAALTGATGFLGGRVARVLASQGWRLRLLVRGEGVDPGLRTLQPQVVRGDLADSETLQYFCQGARAVVHVAGVVKARHSSHFQAVNVDGAGRLAAATRERAPDAAFILVSSLAARAPELSAYAQSKRDGELAVAAALGTSPWIVRPPAIYGPGDRETLGLFRAAAATPILPILRSQVRLPLTHVQDAADAIVALAARAGVGRTVALCDGRMEGYALAEIMAQAALAVGRRPRLIYVAPSVIRATGLMGDLGRLLGATPMVTSGKVRELLHRDWSLSEGELGPNRPTPTFGLAEGFDDTVAGYRAAGWLGPAARRPVTSLWPWR